jgi:glycosyltransferase involved in cell wall biosynthesis
MFAAEAQAAGTPVVASRRGGLAEVIRDDVTGYLVPADDQAAAADALVRVHALSRADCRRHALRSLNVERAAAQHESLYARIARAESPASVSVSE